LLHVKSMKHSQQKQLLDNKIPYRSLDKAILRTPVLSLDRVIQIVTGKTQTVSLRCADTFHKGLLRQALRVASPSLDEALKRDVLKPKKRESREWSLLRYLLRAGSRTTPFGLFANVGMVDITNKSNLCIDDSPVIVITLPDVSVTRRKQWREALIYPEIHLWRVTPSLYELGGAFRFLSFVQESELPKIVSIPYTAQVAAIIRVAQKPAGFADLIEAITQSAHGIKSKKEAKAFVCCLLQTGILMPNNVTSIIYPPNFNYKKEISKIKERPLSAYAESDNFRMDDQYVVSIRRGGSLQVNQAVADCVLSAVAVLARLKEQEPDPLKEFRTRLLTDYADAPVQLLTLLDPEYGFNIDGHRRPPVGDLLTQIQLTNSDEQLFETPKHLPQVNDRHQLNLSLLDEALRNEKTSVCLDDNMLAAFNLPTDDWLPQSLGVVFRLAANSDADIDAGRFTVSIETCSGPSAARLFSRFAHFDKDISDLLTIIASEEKRHNPHAIHAEISSYVSTSLSNTLIRVNSYDAEIVVDAFNDASYQIPVRDIWVRLRDRQVILTHGRDGQEIVPHATHAVNVDMAGALEVYRFLSVVAAQPGFQSLRWNWGVLEEAPFLPRVEYKNSILTCAQWNIRADSNRLLNDELLCRDLERLKVPHLVAIIENNSEGLMLDLRTPICRALLLQELRTKANVRLVEFFPLPENTALRSAEGGYIHDFILPLVRTKSIKPVRQISSLAETTSSASPVKSSNIFPPGSRWLYIRLYCGESVADSILINAIAPLINKFRSEFQIDRWHFLRETDPAHHIRLRFRTRASVNSIALLPHVFSVFNPLVATGILTHFEFATYIPETVRYGGDVALEAVENFFTQDSDTHIALLRHYGDDLSDEMRVLLAAIGTVHFMKDLLPDKNYAASIISQLSSTFAIDFKNEKILRSLSSSLIRRHKSTLCDLVGNMWNSSPELYELGNILTNRRIHAHHLRARLTLLAAESRLQSPVEQIAKSVIHISSNRLFRFAQRQHEAVSYRIARKLLLSSRDYSLGNNLNS
jgi:thiopeptide-type bacteriocin biosynthesis protein